MAAARRCCGPGIVARRRTSDAVAGSNSIVPRDRPDVLVVIVFAGREVLAEAVAAEAGDEAADPEPVGERQPTR